MYVAFYKGRTRLFNRLVCWWLSGPYSHCELVLWTYPDGTAHCASSSFMDGGVRTKDIVLDPAHWDLVRVPGYFSFANALAWSRDHDGELYDLLALVGFVWRRVTGERGKSVCSEAVAAMLGFAESWRLDPMAFSVVMAAINQSKEPKEGALDA